MKLPSGNTQNSKIRIYNYRTEGTIEERILEVLHNRIQIFQVAVGSFVPILETVANDLERLLLSGTVADFQVWNQDLEVRLDRAREADKMLDDFLMDRRSFRKRQIRPTLLILAGQ